MKRSAVPLIVFIVVSSAVFACTKSPETSQTSTSTTPAANEAPATQMTQPSFDVSNLQLAYPKATLSGQQIKMVTTIAKPYSYAALIDIPHNGLPSRALVAVRLKVLKGEIGVGILDQPSNSFSRREFVSWKDGLKTIYLPLESTSDPRQLIIENGRLTGVSQASVQAVRIVSESNRS